MNSSTSRSRSELTLTSINLPKLFGRIIIDVLGNQFRVIVINDGVWRGYGPDPQAAFNNLVKLSEGELIFHSEPPPLTIEGLDLSTLDLDL